MPVKPSAVAPWRAPRPYAPSKMQDKAAFKEKQLEHKASLELDSPVGKMVLSSIICTISEKWCDPECIGRLICAGMKVAIFSMCNVTSEEQAELIRKFRVCVLEYSKLIQRPCPIAVVIELKGPTILTGGFEEDVKEIKLFTDNVFTLTTSRAWEDRGTEERIFVDFANLSVILQKGDKVLLNYGRIELYVRGVVDSDIVCVIVQGGYLTPYTVVTVVGVPLKINPITDKDIEYIKLAVKCEVDAIIVPMVRTAEALIDAKDFLAKEGQNIMLIAKVENRQGYDNFNEILRTADAIIVNRGALSIELSVEKVILAQKNMVARANKAGVPIYAVSEYLSTMVGKDTPTISGVTDVINTILEGADGIILIEQTTIGDYPCEAVRVLSQLCKEAEAQIWQLELFETLNFYAAPPVDPAHSISIAAIEASYKVHAAALLVVTSCGKSARLLARYRPRAPIIAITRHGCTARQMNLFKGVLPVHVLSAPHPCWSKDVDLRFQDGIIVGKHLNIIKAGDPLVLVSSWRPGAGYMNNIRIVIASDETPWQLPPEFKEDLLRGSVRESVRDSAPKRPSVNY